ncbi:MAG: hypothetical protein WCR55_03215 [Lentisphaerota bacterium]
MKHQRALINYSRVKDNDLQELVQGIISQLTKNTNYPNPDPALSVLQASLKAFNDALVKCQHGTKEDTAVKNEKRIALEANLTTLGNYVNSVAKGNTAMLDSSGLPLSKLPQPVGFIPAPENFKVTDGENPGEIYFEMKKNKQSTGNIIAYALSPAPENIEDWHQKTFTAATGWIGGLESGKKYAFKAAHASAKADSIGVYNYTIITERFVQ